MPAVTRVLLVARREVTERFRTRAYQVATLLVAAAAAGLVVVPAMLHRGTVTVGLAGARPPAVQAALTDAAHSAGITLRLRPVTDPSRAITAGQAEVVVVDGARVWVERGHAGDNTARVAEAAVSQVRLAQVLAAAHVTTGTVQSATNVPFHVVGSGTTSAAGRQLAIGALIVIYFALMAGGSWVANAVVEEKAGKLVEMLVPPVRPAEMLTGKVAGVGLVAMSQVGAALVAAAVAAAATGGLHLHGATVTVVGSVLGWFLLGYLFYACAFAAGAALVSRQEDLAAVTTPMALLLGAGYLAALATAGSGASVGVDVLALLPPFAPLVVPVRVAAGLMPWWQASLAAVLTAVATLLVMRLAARLYAGGLLGDTGRMKLLDALRRSRDIAPAGSPR